MSSPHEDGARTTNAAWAAGPVSTLKGRHPSAARGVSLGLADEPQAGPYLDRGMVRLKQARRVSERVVITGKHGRVFLDGHSVFVQENHGIAHQGPEKAVAGWGYKFNYARTRSVPALIQIKKAKFRALVTFELLAR